MNAKHLPTLPDTQIASPSAQLRLRGPLARRALAVISLASLAMVWGCTVTTSSNTPDAGPVGDDDAASPPGDDGAAPPPTPDAGGDASPASPDATVGVLGFTPSNGIDGALAGVDLTMLVDIDVVNADEQLHVDCASMPGVGCVEKTVMQSDGSSIEVYIAKSWKVEPAGALNVTDKTPVVLVATGTINVLGRISARASEMGTVAGGFTGTDDGTAGGPGQGVVGLAYMDSVNTGIPGGGASFCGAGGAAGHATATNGGPGKTYGSPTLVPLQGGSAGGHASLFAGAGGGAVQLVSGTSITIAAGGVIALGGGGGSSGTDTGGYGASGGGSGGAALLEAPTVTVAGIISANGGSGGGGAGGMASPDSTDNATPAPGGQVGTTGAGGTGSAAATITGGAGGAGDAVGGSYSPGAGGGGAGYIRINTSTGVATLTSGTLSPAAGTTCTTQGTLGH
jgi:hypothetical protein